MLVSTTRDATRLGRCIASIERGAGDVPYEVILVLSGADDDVVEAANALAGVRVKESRWNLGFAGASNLGRELARGELLVLLHDDAEAQAGWLPGLVEAAAAHPAAGVIASRVLAYDGPSLQMAGAVIFSDASTALLGRGAAVGAPEHMIARPVDYSSSCSLLVRAETWDAVGGLDPHMFPGGYVDADLGMAAWDAGWVVLYEPSALARHRHEGSMTQGFKTFTHGRNRERFRAKWAAQLAHHEPPAPDVDAAAERAAARAAERAGATAARGRRRSAVKPPPADPELGPRMATLELRLRREYIEFADSELERVHRANARQQEHLVAAEAELDTLRECARTLDAVLAGWWRLRRRLLPLIRLAGRFSSTRHRGRG